MTLSDAQIEYYSRQIILREIGARGQRALLEASVLVAGTERDALTALAYLAGAGVGRLEHVSLVAAPTPRSTNVPFPLPPRRNPDVRYDRYDRSGAPRSIASVDVLLIASDAAASAHMTSLLNAPRIGWIRVDRQQHGVLLASAASTCAGCFACLRAEVPCAGDALGGDRSSPIPHDPDPLALDLAGAMAALAACRWLAGIALADSPRALWLGHAEASFEEIDVRLLETCARDCRGAPA